MLSIPEVMDRDKGGCLFKRDMSDKDRALYIRRCGQDRYRALPHAPFPAELVQEQDLRRSSMDVAAQHEFRAEYGQANLEKIPL